MKFKRAFSSEIFVRRHQLGLTQETVAELAGISTRWYQQIESGRRTPSGQLLLRLCASCTLTPGCSTVPLAWTRHNWTG